MQTLDSIKQALVRWFVVSGCIILVATYFYQANVFIPTRWPFQYFLSGITIGLAYATFRVDNYRIGLLVLVLWYLGVTLPFAGNNSWIFILEAVYIVMIAAGVYIYLYFIRKPFVKDEVRRVGVSILIMGLSNCLIIPVLSLFTIGASIHHLSRLVDTMSLNVQIGALLGLLMGIATEFAEYLVGLLSRSTAVAS